MTTCNPPAIWLYVKGRGGGGQDKEKSGEIGTKGYDIIVKE